MNRIRNRNRSGFNLVELLVTVAMIVVMYVLLASSCSGSYQERQKAACGKNLQHIYVALKTYALDHQSRFPYVEGAGTSEVPLSLLVPRFTAETRIFICPGSNDSALPEAEPFAEEQISYAYYMGRTSREGREWPLMSDEQVSTGPKAAREVVFSVDGKGPGDNHHSYGGALLYADGHTQTIKAHAEVPLPVGPGTTLLNPKP